MKTKAFVNAIISSTALLLGTAALHAAVSQVDAPAVHSPFDTVLFKNFDAWDTNHDGVLSIDEINKLVMDPSIKGDDAAAVGALKLLSRGKTKLPPLTREYFAEYDKRAMAHHGPTTAPADAVTATVDTVSSPSTTQPVARRYRGPADFDLYFAAGKERIAKGGTAPWTGHFELDHARQGPLGDCFFVASVTSLAVHDPDRLAKLVHPAPDGGYVVTLPDTKPVIVPAVTDSELAISSTTAGDGAWLALMEQAFGKFKSREKGNSDDVEGTEIIRTGGDSAPTISALTGHKTLRIPFGKTMEFRKEHADTALPEIRKTVIEALAEHRVITVGMDPPSGKLDGTPVSIPKGINIHHVYALIGYDPKTDIVEIWNPHGQQFIPDGRPGLKNGYPTEHGQFKLPLTEAYQFYTCFTFEQAIPTTKP